MMTTTPTQTTCQRRCELHTTLLGSAFNAFNTRQYNASCFKRCRAGQGQLDHNDEDDAYDDGNSRHDYSYSEAGDTYCKCRAGERELTASTYESTVNQYGPSGITKWLAGVQCIPAHAFRNSARVHIQQPMPELRCIGKGAMQNAISIVFSGVFPKLETISTLAFKDASPSASVRTTIPPALFQLEDRSCECRGSRRYGWLQHQQR